MKFNNFESENINLYIKRQWKEIFRIIKKHQRFNPSLRAIKNKEGFILMEPENKAKRWKEYFIELFVDDKSKPRGEDNLSKT